MQLVIGDIVQLEQGDFVFADMRIISSEGIEVRASILTNKLDGRICNTGVT